MPKTSKRPTLAQRGTFNPSANALDSVRTPRHVTRQKPQRRRASSLLSILSTFSDSLPPVEDLFSAIGKPLPPSAIDKINFHFRKLSKLVSGETEQKFADETAAFQQTLDIVH